MDGLVVTPDANPRVSASSISVKLAESTNSFIYAPRIGSQMRETLAHRLLVVQELYVNSSLHLESQAWVLRLGAEDDADRTIGIRRARARRRLFSTVHQGVLYPQPHLDEPLGRQHEAGRTDEDSPAPRRRGNAAAHEHQPEGNEDEEEGQPVGEV